MPWATPYQPNIKPLHATTSSIHCMLAAYFMSNIWFKRVLSVTTFGLLLAGSYLEPLNISVLSSLYTSATLLYRDFPRITVAYLRRIKHSRNLRPARCRCTGTWEFVEASIEFSAIAIFATGGTFYKQNWANKLNAIAKTALPISWLVSKPQSLQTRFRNR